MGRRHHNAVRTAALFGAVWAVLLVLGWLIGSGGSRYMWVFAGIALVVTGYSCANFDTLAIRSMRARPVSQLEQPMMYRVVRELSTAAHQPMPRLFVSPTMAPNAFTTGRTSSSAAVCCTEGLLELLDEPELRGVLGHELMHVYHRDMLTSSVAAGIARAITAPAQLLFFVGGGDRDRGSNPLASLVLLFLAPVAGVVIHLAISRSWEYDADEGSVALTGDPVALASALHKLAVGTQTRPLPTDQRLVDVSHLMIVEPFRADQISRLFSTHPPLADRIARLEAMAGDQGDITGS